MFTAFSTALSGLNAMTTGIDVVGNNLANLNTTGYKTQTVSFQDLVAQSLSGSATGQVGLGTSAPKTSAQFLQGAITSTSGSYDGAINGGGFFVVKNASAQDLYTRAGDFALDTDGYLTTQSGDRVQGWSAVNGAINASGALGDIQVPVGQAIPGVTSTQFSGTINLDSSTPSPVGTAPGGSWATGAINVYDSLGNKIPLSIDFTKGATDAATGLTTWAYGVSGTGVTVSAATNTGTLTFDSSGILTGVTPTGAAAPMTSGSIPLALSGFADGSASTTVNWQVYDANNAPLITQFSEASNLAAQTQDGSPAAVLTGVSLQDGGKIVATYSNGAQQQTVAQLALASIRNPQSFIDVGNNNFSLSTDSATPTVGASGVGGLGTIDGGSVESSTVDIATEFSNLLTYERSYQANSKVVTVSDELAQDAVALIK